MKVRAYAYKCQRCGVIFEETELAEDADFVAENIYVYTIPDSAELKFLEKRAQELDAQILKEGDNDTGWHECEDEGLGIALLVGCSAPYDAEPEEEFPE